MDEFNNFNLNTWSLQWYGKEGRRNANTAKFCIEQVYGEFRPKLIPCYKDPKMWSNLLASNREKDGYLEKAKCVWQIVLPNEA